MGPEMDKHQIISVLDKLHNEIKSELDNILYKAADASCKLDLSGNEMNAGKYNKVKFCYDDSQGILASSITVHRQSEGISVEISTFKDKVEGYYYIKYKFFDSVWWKWRDFSNMIKDHMRTVKRIKKQVEKNKYDLRFNDAYVTMFPDEINNILLGDKDD